MSKLMELVEKLSSLAVNDMGDFPYKFSKDYFDTKDEIQAIADSIPAMKTSMQTQLQALDTQMQEQEEQKKESDDIIYKQGESIKNLTDKILLMSKLIPKWISVKDGLPESNEEIVWVALITEGEITYQCGQMNDLIDFETHNPIDRIWIDPIHGGSYPNDRVTHWQRIDPITKANETR